jgi:hypothetical protein
MIFCEYASPTPGRAFNWSAVAVLMSSSGAAGAAMGAAAIAAGPRAIPAIPKLVASNNAVTNNFLGKVSMLDLLIVDEIR